MMHGRARSWPCKAVFHPTRHVPLQMAGSGIRSDASHNDVAAAFAYKLGRCPARTRAMNPPIASGRVFNAVRFTISRLVT